MTARAELQRCKALAESRRVRAEEAVAYANLLQGQKLRLQRRHDALLQIVADHLTPALKAAVEKGGFRAELEWSLLDRQPDGGHTEAVSQ